MNILGLNITREKRTQDETPATAPEPTYSPAGLTFGQFFVQSGSMSLSAVYRCVELISDSVAMLPIRVRHGNETVEEHPIYGVLNDRNNVLTKYNFVKLLIQSVLLRGNGYAYIERNGDGSVKALRFVDSTDVTINYNKKTGALSYYIQVIGNKKIEPINLIHLKKYTTDGVTGISVISAADKTLKISKYAEASAESFYSKGGNINGVILSKQPMNPKQKKQFIDDWQSRYGQGGQGIGILDGGEMSYQSVQVNAKDAQLLETRQWNATDIARFFGVAPSMIGINTGSSYGSVEAEQLAFIQHTLMPYIAMVEGEFSKKLLKGTETNFKIDLDETALLRADKNATANYYSTLVDRGILTRNEARKALGYGEVEGGDDLVVAYTDIAQNTIGKKADENQQ